MDVLTIATGLAAIAFIMLVVQAIKGNYGPLEGLALTALTVLFFRFMVYTPGVIKAVNDNETLGLVMLGIAIIGLVFGTIMLRVSFVDGGHLHPLTITGLILFGHMIGIVLASLAHPDAYSG